MSGTVTSPVYACGWECRNLPTANVSAAHHVNLAGTPAIDTTVFNPNGGAASLLIDTTGGAAARWVSFGVPASHRVETGRFYYRLATTPGGTTNILQLNNANGSFDLQVMTTNKFRIVLGATTGAAAGVALTTGVWYRVDYRVDFSGATATADVQFQQEPGGTITTMTQVTNVQAASDITSGQIGCISTQTIKANIDDLVITGTSGDYPIGPGGIIGYAPTSNGTHSFTANDFQDDTSANLATNETTSWAKLDEFPAVNTDFVKQVVIRAAGYLEYLYGTTSRLPRAVEQITWVHNVSTTGDTQKAQLYDGTTATDAYALTSAGSVAGTIRTFTKQWATAPTGAWTAALFAALRLRWGLSTNVTTNPALDASMIEAEFATLSVAAGNAAGTGAAGAPTVTLGATGAATTGTGAASTVGGMTVSEGATGAAAATGAAGAASESIAAPIGAATGTGSASNATGTQAVAAAATAATGSGAATAPATFLVSSSIGSAVGTGAVGATEATDGVAGGSGQGTGAAAAPTLTVLSGMGAAAGTGAVGATHVSIQPHSGNVLGIAYAEFTEPDPNNPLLDITVGPRPNVEPSAGSAAGTGQATAGVSGSLTLRSGEALGTGTAFDAHATPAQATAGLASGAGTATGPSEAVSPVLAVATGTGAALAPTVTAVARTDAAAITAFASGVAQGTAQAVVANAGSIAGTAAASGPAVAAMAAGTGVAVGSGTAVAPSQGAKVPSGAAAGTGAATAPASAMAPRSDIATGDGAAFTTTVIGFASQAAGVGASVDPKPNVGPSAAQGAGTGAAATTTSKVSAGQTTATGTSLVPNPFVVTLSDHAAAAGIATGTGAAANVQGVNVVVSAGIATGAGAAAATLAAISAATGAGAGTGAAYAAALMLGVIPSTATGIGLAADPSAGSTTASGVASGIGRAYDPKVRQSVPTEYAIARDGGWSITQ